MGEIGYAGAFLGGAVAVFSPCAALLLPSFFAFAFSTRGALVGRALLFYLGLLTTLVPLGVAAGTLGGSILTHRLTFITIGAWLVIALGIVQTLGISGPSTSVRQRRDPASPLGTYVLGLTYGLASGCTGPILGTVLTVAAIQGNAFYGAILLALFSLGMVLPILILALLWDRFDLGRRAWLRPRPFTFGPIHTTVLGVASGLSFLGIGVLLLLTEGTGNLGGLLSARRQYDLENAVVQGVGSVPDVVVLLAVIALFGVLGWVWTRRRDARFGP